MSTVQRQCGLTAFQGPESSAAEHDVVIERNVAVPMSDGMKLRADIYRPATPGRYPVLIERVGYERSARCVEPGDFFARRGYVFVGQSVRGVYGSEGEFAPFRDDGWGVHRDGYDTIEWAADQAWSSGSVGMLDGSYSGYTQYLAAVTRPPHLKALCVRAGLASLYHDWVYRGGAHQLAVREWALRAVLLPQFSEDSPSRLRVEETLQELARWNQYLPSGSCPPMEGVADWYLEWLAHPTYADYWTDLDVTTRLEDIEVPAVHFSGWFDIFLDASLRCFAGLREHGGTAACRAGQRLIIGPWQHGPTFFGNRRVGELDFGPEAEFDRPRAQLRWYDHFLKGQANGVLDGPPVQVFLMGANHWLDLDSWPPPGISYRPAYFRSEHGWECWVAQ